MTNLLFATKLPPPTVLAVREEARRQRRNINTIADAAFRKFLALPEAQREEFTIGEPMTIETAASILGRTGPARHNKKRGAK